ncbi:hypothetical protein GCM10010505_26220 [Kitasatospora aburaviensis]
MVRAASGALRRRVRCVGAAAFAVTAVAVGSFTAVRFTGMILVARSGPIDSARTRLPVVQATPPEWRGRSARPVRRAPAGRGARPAGIGGTGSRRGINPGEAVDGYRVTRMVASPAVTHVHPARR